MQTSPTKPDLRYTFIKTSAELADWADDTREHDWIAFDTEFIGEKRFRTLVCLIQVASPDGLFLIDPIAVEDLGPFLDLVEDPDVVKITHAGENDYRLLFQNYDCRPRNLVDTQLGCGFLSDQYPVNVKRLVAEHLGITLRKGFAVVDWAKRPIQKDALKYALEDVVYLRDMYHAVIDKLTELERLDWFHAEMKTWEDTARYEKTLLDEVKAMGSVYKMKRAEKVFMIRMIEWRRDLAEKRDHSREMVLQTKDLTAVVKLIRNGRSAFTSNRHLKNKSWLRYIDQWEQLYRTPPTPTEESYLAELTPPANTDLRQEVVGEILYKYLSYFCMREQLAIDIVVPRSVMRDLRVGDQEGLNRLGHTWRGEFLGADVLALLSGTANVEPVLEGKAIVFAPLGKG